MFLAFSFLSMLAIVFERDILVIRGEQIKQIDAVCLGQVIRFAKGFLLWEFCQCSGCNVWH